MTQETEIRFGALEVAIVENNPTDLAGLMKTLKALGCSVAWTTKFAGEAKTLAETKLPDVVFVDLRLLSGPEANDYSVGLQLIQDLRGINRNVAIIVYSHAPVTDEVVLEAIRLGCSYLIKEDLWEAEQALIASALLAARSNAVLLSNDVARNVEVVVNRIKGSDILTERQREVLALAADGYTDREIAEELVLGLTTVKTHMRNIFMKLGVNNRGQASRWYHEHYG